MRKYRIVKDCFAGYEAQVMYWWLPFIYFQIKHYPMGMGNCNTSRNIVDAEKVIQWHKEGKVVKQY
jgi:hypothetical protein